MKTIQQKLSDVELDIQNLSTFIDQCMEKLKCKLCQYHQLQKDLYVQDGLERLNNYATKEPECAFIPIKWDMMESNHPDTR